MKTNLLSNIPLFSDLPTTELEHLQELLGVKYLKAREMQNKGV